MPTVWLRAFTLYCQKAFASMKRNASRKTLESLCGQVGPDDGLDPRDFFRKKETRGTSRKDWQLCRQVAETLNYVLSGEAHDDVLLGLLVQQVEPAPDASRLLVTVGSLDRSDQTDPSTILLHLQQATKRLRAEVASSISRKKAPELIFHVAFGNPANESHTGAQP